MAERMSVLVKSHQDISSHNQYLIANPESDGTHWEYVHAGVTNPGRYGCDFPARLAFFSWMMLPIRMIFFMPSQSGVSTFENIGTIVLKGLPRINSFRCHRIFWGYTWARFCWSYHLFENPITGYISVQTKHIKAPISLLLEPLYISTIAAAQNIFHCHCMFYSKPTFYYKLSRILKNCYRTTTLSVRNRQVISVNF